MNRLAVFAFQYIVLALLFLLPFHAFGVTFVNSLIFDVSSAPPLLLSVWKEIVIVLLILISGIAVLLNYKKFLKEWDELDALVIGFSFLALLIAGWQISQGESLKTIAMAVRYDLLFMWLFLAFKHMPSELMSNDFIKKMINVLLMAGGVVLVFGLIQKFLPTDFLVNFGYLGSHSVDFADKPAAYCQFVSETDICRLQSFFAGPIRFGAFIVMFMGLLFLRKDKTWKFVLPLALLAVFWTFSRSAWLATIVLLVALACFSYREKIKQILNFRKVLAGVVTLVLLAGIFAFAFAGNIGKILVRQDSTSPRIEALIETGEIITTEPVGIGLGYAGPASTFLAEEDEFLNENWYLQIFVEMGVIGGILFLAFVLMVLWRLYKNRKNDFDKTMFSILFALSFMALFTHVWETPAVVYTTWILVGIACRDESVKM